VCHRNAPLTETGRLRLARCVVDDGWPVRRAAQRFQVSPSTASKWAGRYRLWGEAGMGDVSSRPHRSPCRTPSRTERRIIKVRVLRRWGPARIAFFLGLNPATVHRVLTRYNIARLAHLDRATGHIVRRYEHARPGDLVHVDIKKLGNIPDGGGSRAHGLTVGKRNSQRTVTTHRRAGGKKPAIGHSYLHTALDDHSRLVYTEILADETQHTAAAFWRRARDYFTACGTTVHRVLTDNGPCYRSQAWHHALTETGIRHKRTRPYRPQTNGKVERFHRTLTEEWAYAHPYTSETQRRQTLPTWIHTYNHHRGHTALAGQPPATRVHNLTRHNR